MTPLERKKIQDSINQEFNLFKKTGSTLLQAGRINAKTYYKNVRQKGIDLGIINEDEYPTDLPGWAEPTMRITGATLGAIGGAAGGIGGMSVGAGVGGGAATAVYREFAELLNPDLPIAPMNKKIRDVGVAGATDFAGTLIFGGAANAIGNMLGRGQQLSSRQIKNLGSKGDKELSKIKKDMPRKTSLLGKLVTRGGLSAKAEKEVLDEVAGAFEREGLTPYLGLVTGEMVRAYFQSSGVLPIIGGPVRGRFREQVQKVVARIVGDTKKLNAGLDKDGFTGISGLHLAESDAANIWTMRKTVGGKEEIIRNPDLSPNLNTNLQLIGEGRGVTNSGTTLIQNIQHKLSHAIDAKKKAYQEFDDALIKSGTKEAAEESTKRFNLTEKLTKDNENIGSIADYLGLNATNRNSKYYIGKDISRISADSVNYIRRSIIPSILSGIRSWKVKGWKGDITGKDYLRLYSNVRDKIKDIKASAPLGQNLSAQNQHAKAKLLGLQKALEERLKGQIGATGEDLSQMLGRAENSYGTMVAEVNLNKEALAFMGRDNQLTKVLKKELQPDDASAVIPNVLLPTTGTSRSIGDVMNKYWVKSNPADQQYFKSLIGEKEYKSLVNSEIDDILEKNYLIPMINEGKAPAALKKGLEKELKTPLMRQRLIEAHGKQLGNTIYNNFDRVTNIMPYLLQEPNLNNFVLRNAILSKGAIGIGSMGILGYSLGGPLGTAVSMGVMWQISKFLAKPYGQTLLAQANVNTAAGREAIKKISNDFTRETKLPAKATKIKERALAIADPRAYKRYLELLRQAGVEYTGQAVGALPTNTSGVYQ